MTDGAGQPPHRLPIQETDILSDEIVDKILHQLAGPDAEALTRHMMACEKFFDRDRHMIPQTITNPTDVDYFTPVYGGIPDDEHRFVETLNHLVEFTGHAKAGLLLSAIIYNKIPRITTDEAYKQLHHDARCMLLNFARQVGYPTLPKPDQELPDFFLLKVNNFIKNRLKDLTERAEKWDKLEEKFPDQVCSKGHDEIRFWSEGDDNAKCPLCEIILRKQV